MKTTVVLLLLVGLVSVRAQCPRGASASNDGANCFHPVPLKTGFHEAKQVCQLMGGHLATFHDEQDPVIVQEALWKLLPGQEFWIGARKEDDFSKWTWTDKSAFDMMDGPQEFGLNCLSVNKDGDWVGSQCCDQKPFVCVRPMYGNACPFRPQIPIDSKPVSFEISLKRLDEATCRNALSDGAFKTALVRFENGKITSRTELEEFVWKEEEKLTLENPPTATKTFTFNNTCDDPVSVCDRVDAVLVEYYGSDALYLDYLTVNFKYGGGVIRTMFNTVFPRDCYSAVGLPHWLDGDACSYLTASQPPNQYPTAYYLVVPKGAKYAMNYEDVQKFLQNDLPSPKPPCTTA